ncbi:DNA-binding GntR family transcriptional regulator [Bacillus ectoiniformans]|uniref:GntR family transcriptional regulator n=1 Tax=Bacillus ectoiniformans TaxID=1494429 RepID=UPI00195ACD6E|nr:GntR family transcriptional regulator [Bacillus ectoiniformans]MBM7649425.1 DNA-binding GntR family transcriptional regulator [Bacillus ectoiniformans]
MENKIQRETLAEKAYQSLKMEITQGRIQPGDALPEEKIAAMLGISRTPLRAAINRLAYEGLILLEKGKKARVAGVTDHNIAELVELRQLLEPYAIQSLTEDRLHSDFLINVKTNLSEQQTAIESKDYQRFVDLDMQFHLLFSSEAKNRKLAEIIEQINTAFNRRFAIVESVFEKYAANAYEEHVQVYQLLINGKSDQAAEVMANHIQSSSKRLISNEMKEEME